MRTVIDIDKELLEAVQQRLGVSTMKETVHMALRAVLDRDEERAGAIEAFEFWRTEGSPDLLDPEVMKGACPRPE
ncbi:type II toxin-antitoxin system VapB family antitoxin [Nonomuraea muscovyensis]|uniref:type II toxin-antitoxin system VapB family antitoxin n=1 Tax=Nonomuraea muscovyensis TaxID=1124761 RepID=UPI0033C84B63